MLAGAEQGSLLCPATIGLRKTRQKGDVRFTDLLHNQAHSEDAAVPRNGDAPGARVLERRPAEEANHCVRHDTVPWPCDRRREKSHAGINHDRAAQTCRKLYQPSGMRRRDLTGGTSGAVPVRILSPRGGEGAPKQLGWTISRNQGFRLNPGVRVSEPSCGS